MEIKKGKNGEGTLATTGNIIGPRPSIIANSGVRTFASSGQFEYRKQSG